MRTPGRASLLLLAAVTAYLPCYAADPMPVAQQNALVQKYCAVCHTDAIKNGGLTLQHFDAAMAPPSLTAMMLSKLKANAMGAAGIPIPDKVTIDALVHAFTAQSAGATEWNIECSTGELTASILRESPSGANASDVEFYRLIARCNSTTRQGELQLTWSPAARSGAFSATIDGGRPVEFIVQGNESMGNGSGLVLHALASRKLDGLTLPTQTLTVSHLFPGQTVSFPFTQLPDAARRELQPCFTAAH